jgi:hypothetical protein
MLYLYKDTNQRKRQQHTNMLDTNLIIIEVPYLSIGKVGKESEIKRLKIVEAIFYRLKTGCQ